jgi:hypothetical protein
MRAEGEFAVAGFTPAEGVPEPDVTTAVSVGIATMEKTYTGDIEGRSVTMFTAAYDQESGVGTYVAMESFEGSLHGASGSFNYAHSATTTGADRFNELFVIVPSSGTDALAGISGSGGMAVDSDGTHRIWFDYEIGE